jgi:hypothetical protein
MAQESGFITAVDSAIKEKLEGITVHDDREGARPVKVFFRYPEPAGNDPSIEKHYPFIVIEMLDILHATEREISAQTIYAKSVALPAGDPMRYKTIHSNGNAILPYWPDEETDVGALLSGTAPVESTIELTPVDFLYQISTHARSYAHDRQMQAALFARNRIPFRYGTLFVDADGTSRRFTNLGWQQRDLADGEAGNRKRIFRKVFTVTVSGELPFAYFSPTGIVDTVHVGIESIPDSFGH